MKNVLVIAPQFIGDSILAIPFLRELKKHVGRVDVDVVSKNAGCLIYKKCPYVNKVYDLKKLKVRELRENDYGKVYVLKRSLSAAILAFRLGIKERIGFGGQFREILLTKSVKYDKTEQKHELEHFMDVLEADYVEINSKKLEYYTDEASINNISGYLGDKKKALVVACSSTYVKNWTQKGFAQAIDFLEENGYEVYFTGLEKEKEYCDEILMQTKSKSAKNLCGVHSLDESIALVSQMDLVFGVDSGFCHVASAFGKKVITLFGPTSVSQWAPVGGEIVSLNLDCAPCRKPRKCENNFECLQALSVDNVISALRKVL